MAGFVVMARLGRATHDFDEGTGDMVTTAGLPFRRHGGACYRRGDEASGAAPDRAGGTGTPARPLPRSGAAHHALVDGRPGAHGPARRRRPGDRGVLARAPVAHADALVAGAP